MRDRAASIAKLGRVLGPDVLATSQALFSEEQFRLAEGLMPIATDSAYGADERNSLDLYSNGDEQRKPVLLWVHGGGFVRGDKAGPGSPYNAHIGRWAVRNGMVGAVMNYRFAPHWQWPSGIEDVAAAVTWLEVEGAGHGIDPSRIILAGTSAGAVHLAGYVARGAATSVKGAVMLSGLYGFTDLEDRDCLYYGDKADYPQRMPRDGIVGADLPLFVACAEHDPLRFQQEYAGLIAARLERHGALPTGAVVGGHNHFTLAMHIGTSDMRLANQILAFVSDAAGVTS